MKAVRFGGEQKVAVAEAPKPVAAPDQALIRVQATALCGSELGAFRGNPPEGFLNPGHEVVGLVETAPADSEWEAGMRVGARVVIGCGTCPSCRRGAETGCANYTFYPNAHAEYFAIPARGLLPVPDGVEWPAAAILTGDGLGLPARAARRIGSMQGQHVLVLGLGPVGLSSVLVQAFRGAHVMGADLVGYRLELAGKLGAEHVVNIETDNLPDTVGDWTDGRGLDLVIVAAGRADALNTAIDLVRRQGTVLQLGELREATINPSAAFIRKEITMTGSWYYAPEDWPTMLELHNDGLPYPDLITHVFPFQEAQQAYDTFASGQSGKVVLTYQ